MEATSPISAPRDQVQQLLDAEVLVPVHKPNVIDACSFHEALANALVQCTPPLFFDKNVGHRFLIEFSINYQAHTGVNAIPEWPTTPATLGTAPNTLQLWPRETQQKSFVICSHLDNEVKCLLQAKFPGMFNTHFMRRTKYLPPLMQAREALDKIQTKVYSAPRATNEQMELVQQVINHAYTPSVMGAEMHFYASKTDQHRSRHLGIDPILDNMIMNAALRVFSVEHHGEQLKHISESWTIINGATNSPQDEYKWFKEH